MVDVEDAEVLLVLEAVGEGVGPCGGDLVVVEEEHVEAHVIAQGFRQPLRPTVVDLILTQVHSLKGEKCDKKCGETCLP